MQYINISLHPSILHLFPSNPQPRPAPPGTIQRSMDGRHHLLRTRQATRLAATRGRAHGAADGGLAKAWKA